MSTGPLEMQYVNRGGRRLSTYVSGEGGPAVVLESGLQDAANVWREVQDGVARFARVASYDRAGLGKSDAAPVPRGLDECVDDLTAVIDALSPNLPVVLAGHSLGGLIVLRFAMRFPARVAGLVLADSSHPRQMGFLIPVLNNPAWAGDPAVEQYRNAQEAIFSDPDRNVEHIDVAAGMALFPALPALESMPLCVLTASDIFSGLGLPPRAVEALRTVWRNLHADLALMSSNARVELLHGSEHYVFRTHPAEVVEAIRWAVSSGCGRDAS